jgi:hypothetical protein
MEANGGSVARRRCRYQRLDLLSLVKRRLPVTGDRTDQTLEKCYSRRHAKPTENAHLTIAARRSVRTR